METDKKFFARVRVRAIIINDGKLLGVKHPHDTSFCALPGGHLEHKEEIKECLQREIIEELGIKPEIGRLLYVNNFIDADEKQSIEFFFEITNSQEYKNMESLPKTHAHEIAEIVWVNPADDVRIMPKGLEDDFKAGKILSDEVRFIFC